AGSLRQEGGRIEWRRRWVAAFPMLNPFDDGRVAEARKGHEGLRPVLVPERSADGGRLDWRVSRNQRDVPEGPGHEILAIPFPVRRESQRGGLHPARGEQLSSEIGRAH